MFKYTVQYFMVNKSTCNKTKKLMRVNVYKTNNVNIIDTELMNSVNDSENKLKTSFFIHNYMYIPLVLLLGLISEFE